MTSSGDLWQVKLPNGDVHSVTLDQLDEAFQGGHINEDTLVLPSSGTRWMKLAEAAGLEDAAAETSTAASSSAQAYSARAPVPVPMAAPAAVAPRAAYVPQAAPVPTPHTLRPISLDLGAADDFDLDAMRLRSGGSRKRWVFAVVGVAALAGVAGLVTTRGLGASSGSSAAAAVMAPPPAAVAPPPAPVAPTPAAPVANTSSSDNSGGSALNPRFNDQTRQKLIESDKQREQKTKARAGSSTGSSSHGSGSSRTKSTSGFTTGGNKYDPLNSSI